MTAILLVGCASSSGTKQQVTTSEGNVVTTYDDPQYGIRLTYPGDWQEQSVPFMMRPKGTIIVLIAPSDLGATKMPPTLSVVAQDVKAGNNPEQLDAMQKQIIDKAGKQFGDFKLVESGAAKLGSEQARRVVYTGTKMGVSVEVMNVVTLHNGRQYGVAYSSDPVLYSQYLPQVQRVIDSVQFAK